MKAIDGAGRRGAYHISTGSDYAIKDLFDATVKAMNVNLEKDVEVRPRSADDVFSILLDPSDTERDFHWKASTTLAAGVNDAIGWYRENEVTETFTHLKPVAAAKAGV